MIKTAKERDYYDFSPTGGNLSGDIWRDLPTYGLLGIRRLPGIIITPACDVAQRKVPMVTYLPIVTIPEYFSTISSFSKIKEKIKAQMNNLDMGDVIEWPIGNLPPNAETLDHCECSLSELLQSKKLNKKKEDSLKKILAGIRILKCIANSSLRAACLKDLEILYGEKKWGETLADIVTNSFDTNVHFLPKDNQNASYSAIKEHSVVLLRYPITAPVEVLDYAQDVSLTDWDGAISKIENIILSAGNFKAAKPLKSLSLRTPFLIDLLTRYIAIYIRIGSPDFTPDIKQRICNDIYEKED